nr:hypothetical protein [Sphingomonas sp. CV7422]
MTGVGAFAPNDDNAAEHNQHSAQQDWPSHRITEQADAERGTDQRLDVYENACTGAIDAGRTILPRGRGEEGGEKTLPDDPALGDRAQREWGRTM